MSFRPLGSGARYHSAKRLYRDTLVGESISTVSSFEKLMNEFNGNKSPYLTNNIDEIVELALNKKIKYVISWESWLVTDLYYKLNGQNIKFIGPIKYPHFSKQIKFFTNLYRSLEKCSIPVLSKYYLKILILNYNHYPHYKPKMNIVVRE